MSGAANTSSTERTYKDPWSEGLYNCTTGDNYLRHGEYMRLIEHLEGQQAEIEELRESLRTAHAEADRWNQLAAELRAALKELVRLKDLHDACEDQTYWATRAVSEETIAQLRAWEADYAQNKPRAWAAARAALSGDSEEKP